MKILNAKADGPKENGLLNISLYGHTARSSMFRRGIELLRSWADSNVEEEENYNPSGKRARRENGKG